MSESPSRESENFSSFYDRNYKLVYRVCFTYMKSRADAEDCAEDVFVKVLTGSFAFHDEEHEKAWLTVTAMNLCKDRLKHWWHKKTVPLDSFEEMAGEEAPPIDETLGAVLNLPVKYKDVIYLHYYMNYKTEEIAQILHKPASTVRSHLSEARELLRERLGGEVSNG